MFRKSLILIKLTIEIHGLKLNIIAVVTIKIIIIGSLNAGTDNKFIFSYTKKRWFYVDKVNKGTTNKAV